MPKPRALQAGPSTLAHAHIPLLWFAMLTSSQFAAFDCSLCAVWIPSSQGTVHRCLWLSESIDGAAEAEWYKASPRQLGYPCRLPACAAPAEWLILLGCSSLIVPGRRPAASPTRLWFLPFPVCLEERSFTPEHLFLPVLVPYLHLTKSRLVAHYLRSSNGHP